eukprot:9535147-Lingulodinium_polyedra.AAC.1
MLLHEVGHQRLIYVRVDLTYGASELLPRGARTSLVSRTLFHILSCHVVTSIQPGLDNIMWQMSRGTGMGLRHSCGTADALAMNTEVFICFQTACYGSSQCACTVSIQRCSVDHSKRQQQQRSHQKLCETHGIICSALAASFGDPRPRK